MQDCGHTGVSQWLSQFNTLRPRQNGRHFADDTFKPIFLNENIRISIKISLKFVPKVPINNNSALVQIMAWRRPGDKLLSEPMMVCLLTHICVARPQWVNTLELPQFCTKPSRHPPLNRAPWPWASERTICITEQLHGKMSSFLSNTDKWQAEVLEGDTNLVRFSQGNVSS